MSRFLRDLDKALADVHKFSRDILRFTPTKQQSQLLDLIQYETFAPADERLKGIAVKSGQGPGKTAICTVAALFRLLQSPGRLVLVTAPTRRQVEDIWVAELTRRVSSGHPGLQGLLDIQKQKVRVQGFKKWEIVTATSVKPENVQGYHEESMTVIVEEASGIERKIWGTLKGTVTQKGNLLIAIGNPNERDTEFFDMFTKDKALYHRLTWNAEESPNVDKRHIERMAKEYGRDSDVYRVRVLGEFPLESPNVVIRYEDLLHACREMPFVKSMMALTPNDGGARKQIGIDLARFGGDESVIVARYNSAMVGMLHFSKREPADVIRRAFEWQHELGWDDSSTVYCTDAGGMGQGILHMFYENSKRVFEFHSNGTPREPQVYKDCITEAYFHLRQLSRERILHLKEDQTAFHQLVSRQYRYDQGLFRLESKDEFLKRVGTEEYTSPDRADAIALAFYPHACGGIDTVSV